MPTRAGSIPAIVKNVKFKMPSYAKKQPDAPTLCVFSFIFAPLRETQVFRAKAQKPENSRRKERQVAGRKKGDFRVTCSRYCTSPYKLLSDSNYAFCFYRRGRR
jgi:hypothetical protein